MSEIILKKVNYAIDYCTFAQGDVFQMMTEGNRINLMITEVETDSKNTTGLVVLTGESTPGKYGAGDNLGLKQPRAWNWTFIKFLGRFEVQG